MICIVDKPNEIDLYQLGFDLNKTRFFLIGQKIKRKVKKKNFSPRMKSLEYEYEDQFIYEVIDREKGYIPDNAEEKYYEVWSEGRTVEFSKHNKKQMKDLSKLNVKTDIKQELVVGTVYDQYRIIKVTDPEGLLLEQVDLKGNPVFVRLPPEKGLFMPQIKIEGKWYYMTIGINQLTKRPNNPAAFNKHEECEEYIMDYHSAQVAIQRANKKNS